MDIQDLSRQADKLSETMDEFLFKEKQLNDEIALLLENMSQQAYVMANDLKAIAERWGI